MVYRLPLREVNGIMTETYGDQFSMIDLNDNLIEDLECAFIPRNSEIYDDFIWAYYITKSGETGIGRLVLDD